MTNQIAALRRDLERALELLEETATASDPAMTALVDRIRQKVAGLEVSAAETD